MNQVVTGELARIYLIHDPNGQQKKLIFFFLNPQFFTETNGCGTSPSY